MSAPRRPLSFKEGFQASWRTVLASAVIVVGVLLIASADWLPSLQKGSRQYLPFLSALVGVSLYVMSSARRRRDSFDYRYLPDYCYRCAQAVVYVYAILAIMAQAGGVARAGGGVPEFASWPPNLVGLFVGMFIEHVEKAMEGLGQRFEEVLAGLLPRSLAAPTSREKEIRRIRLEQKLEEIRAQTEGLSLVVRDPAAREQMQERLLAATQVVREGDDKLVQDTVNQLAWDFEELKIGTREEAATVAEVLALRADGPRQVQQKKKKVESPVE